MEPISSRVADIYVLRESGERTMIRVVFPRRMTVPLTLAEVEQFACGKADPTTQERVSEALRDPDSELSKLLRAIRDPALSLLNTVTKPGESPPK